MKAIWGMALVTLIWAALCTFYALIGYLIGIVLLGEEGILIEIGTAIGRAL